MTRGAHKDLMTCQCGGSDRKYDRVPVADNPGTPCSKPDGMAQFPRGARRTFMPEHLSFLESA